MDNVTRKVISEAMAALADGQCREHYDTITQEPQLTARIGDRLEESAPGLMPHGYSVRVITQDIPDEEGAHLKENWARIYTSASRFSTTPIMQAFYRKEC